MEFKYRKEKSQIFGDVLRPVMQFEIETKFGWTPILAYVDSGADISLLPMSFVRALNIRVETEEIKEIRGIGEGKISVILKEVKAKICNKTSNIKVAIALVEDVPYILGRKDIFNKFKVIFEEYKEKVSFEDKEC